MNADDLLRDIANSAVTLDDARMDYVEVQIDRETWEQLSEWRVGG